MKKVAMKILDILKIVIVAILIIFLVATAYQKLVPNYPSFFGFRTFSILTDSMKPMLKKSDVILVHEIDIEDYKVGDTITFMGTEDELEDKIVTHQIVNIITENDRRIFYTKGLQNISEDPAVYEEQILGKYIYRFRIFSVIERIMETKFGFVIIIIIPLLLVYAFEIVDIIKNVKSIKKIKNGENEETTSDANENISEQNTSLNNENTTSEINNNIETKVSEVIEIKNDSIN